MSSDAVLGLHHVTAITADIVRNLAFYTGTLGLRLVKKSVNQDDVSAYHLFYADAVGSPGTDLTFFDWPFAASNRSGAGTVARTLFRAPVASLPFWSERLLSDGVDVTHSDSWLDFSDFEGQRLAIVADDGLPGQVEPWDRQVPAEHALRGFYGVELDSQYIGATKAVLSELLGFPEVESGVFEHQSESAFSRVVVNDRSAGPRGYPGRGGVHHVAFRARDDEQLFAIQRKVEAAGLGTSGFVDRFYFHSLYFREPGGVLFEIATEGPGMHADEPMDHLGERLALPPFLEPRRAEIEAKLKPLPPPAYLS